MIYCTGNKVCGPDGYDGVADAQGVATGADGGDGASSPLVLAVAA